MWYEIYRSGYSWRYRRQFDAARKSGHAYNSKDGAEQGAIDEVEAIVKMLNIPLTPELQEKIRSGDWMRDFTNPNRKSIEERKIRKENSPRDN